MRPLVTIGFFGAFTTFSTYANESVALMRAGDWIGMAGEFLGTDPVYVETLIGLAFGRQFQISLKQ